MKEEGMAAGGVRQSQEGPESPLSVFTYSGKESSKGASWGLMGRSPGVPKEKAWNGRPGGQGVRCDQGQRWPHTRGPEHAARAASAEPAAEGHRRRSTPSGAHTRGRAACGRGPRGRRVHRPGGDTSIKDVTVDEGPQGRAGSTQVCSPSAVTFDPVIQKRSLLSVSWASTADEWQRTLTRNSASESLLRSCSWQDHTYDL